MVKHSKQSEKNWQLLVNGDQQGLYECFYIFYDDLYRFGLSLYRNPELVKESINILFIELWRIKHKLSEVQNMQQYVLTIFKRVMYKTYQQYARDTFTDIVNCEEIELAKEQPYENILIASQQDEITKKRLQKALNQLSPRQMEIITMRYFDQASIDDIALKTGLTDRTIYNTLHNAIKVLRDVFSLLIMYQIIKQ